MKKIFVMLLVAGCFLGMASCSDDNDNQATQMGTVKVLSAATSLKASPDTGSVVVDCNPMKAYVAPEDEPWLKVEVKGDSVKFYAKQNESTESRNSLLTIKKSDNDSVQVNVIQRGMIFILSDKVDITRPNDNAFSTYFKVNTDYVGQLENVPEWVNAKFEDDRLKIDVQENNEGHLRTGYVTYSCGNLRDSVKITQCDLAKDILGDYEIWEGYDADADLCQNKIPAKLTQNISGALYLTFTMTLNKKDVELYFPVTFNSDSIAISMKSGERLANYSDAKGNKFGVYTMFATDNGVNLPSIDAQTGDTIYHNESGLISAHLTYDKRKGTHGMFQGLAYNEGGYTGTFYSMYIGVFKNNLPYKKNLVNNTWYGMNRMMLVKKEK